MLDAGVRLGEVCALAWADVDFAGATIRVHRHLERRKGGGWRIAEGTKTDAGDRVVDLTPATVAALKAHRATQIERRLKLGAGWRDLGLVFDRGDGDHERPGIVQHAFDRAVRRAGLPRLTPHGLRHTSGALMAEAGYRPHLMKDRLGHASIVQTDQYTHASRRMRGDAAARLADVLDGEHRERVTSA
jgi:integrase